MTASAGDRPARRLGIDVGGTKTLGVVLDRFETVAAHRVAPTPRGGASAPQVVEVIAQVAESLGVSPDVPVGVGVPGLVNRQGVLRAAPNLDGVADLDVASGVALRLGRSVTVDNDATCAAFAEWRTGAARGADDVVLVTMGTGIGGGAVLGGVLYRGANGFAGEFGHMVVDPNGPRCPCGRRGCWERYASGSGLAMLARDAATGHRLRHVVELAGGDPQAVRGEHVQDAARDGDPDAAQVIDEFGRWVALGLSNLTNALDPEVIVLGGGLATGADLYLGPIEAWFERFLYRPDLRRRPEVVFAQWGSQAGAAGAAMLAAEDRAMVAAEDRQAR